jgi:hypothetical protein
MMVQGQVVDPGGKPIAGAELLLDVSSEDLGERRRLGKTGPDGRFTVKIPRFLFEPDLLGSTPFVDLAATLPGFGPGWTSIDPKPAPGPITIKLCRDDVAIEGLVIGPEGWPVPGVTVELSRIAEIVPDELEKLRAEVGRESPQDVPRFAREFVTPERGDGRAVETGADGRFRFTGVGRDRVATLYLKGGGVVEGSFTVTTIARRAEKPPGSPDGRASREPESREFTLHPEWGRVIEGTVRDRDTGQPVAGAKVSFLAPVDGYPRDTSDEKGRYRIEGVPRKGQGFVLVDVEDRPYIQVCKPIEFAAGPNPLRLDLALKRGVWVEGKVTKASNGKVAKSTIYYYPARDNPHLQECPDAPFVNARRPLNLHVETNRDGRFRTAVIPGRGILVVQAHAAGFLLAGPVDERVAREFLYMLDSPQTLTAQAILPIDVPAGKGLVVPETRLTAGPVQHILLTDVDDRPVAGAIVDTLNVQWFIQVERPLPDHRVTYQNVNPGKAETLIFLHEGRSIGGAVVLEGREPDPIKVILRPCGTATGRLVDAQGRPRAGVTIRVDYILLSRGQLRPWSRFDSQKTGPDGRFRIKNLVPGMSYSAEIVETDEATGEPRFGGYLHRAEWTVKLGELQEWGDVMAMDP